MFKDLFNSPFELYYFGRHTAYYGVRRHVFSYYCSGGYNGTATYSDSREQSDITPYPNILFYNDILVISLRFILLVKVGNEHPYSICMVTSLNCKARSYSTIAFADEFRVNCRNSRVVCKIAIFVEIYIFRIPD